MMVKAKYVAIGLLFLGAASCSWRDSRAGSVLVIAIEGLSSDLVSCESDQMAVRDMDGFRMLCEESVRFSHAYTSSTLSEPALTSLLTSLYPIEHQVRHNGNDHLSAKVFTVAEAAVRSGYRTALISGGPPILRKSGLSQGFEIFDDNVNPVEMYRPAREAIEAFLKWMKKEALPDRFFSVLYFSDLQFPDRMTQSELGEVRDRSAEAQLREVGESLGYLIRELKRIELWNSMHVMVIGLNGSLNYHPDEIQPLNLFAESTQISLFIKPQGKARDLGLQWSIDKNVSIVDAGRTLYDWVKVPAPDSVETQLPRVSLSGVLSRPEVDWDEDRLVLVESAWGAWREMGPVRYSARYKQYVYIHDLEPQIFNTLIDRMETNPLPKGDPLWLSLSGKVLNYFKTQKWPKWIAKDPQWVQRLRLAHDYWTNSGDGEPKLQAHLQQIGASDRQMVGWLIGAALARRDARGLISLGESFKNWAAIYVGKRMLNERVRAVGFPCAVLFRVLRNPLQGDAIRKACQDPMLVRLYEWAHATDDEVRSRSREAFMKMYSAQLMESALGRLNYTRFLTWDSPLQLPRLATLSEMYLALPRNAKLEEYVRTRTLRKDTGLDL